MTGAETKDGGKRRTRAPSEEGVATQIGGMIAALWESRQRNKIIMLLIGLTVVVAATAYAQIELNAWNRPFYDALSHKNVPVFLAQLGVFAELAIVLLILNVGQAWLNQKSKLVLREGLVENLLSEWLVPLRGFRVSYAGEIGENPDQRIHEDARHLTELATDLGIGLLQSSLLLLSFITVLWVLSDRMVLSIAGRTFVAPGYMVWAALIYAAVASLISWRVGRSLIRLNEVRYAHEAQFRFALVRANEEIEGVTLYGGEDDEKNRLSAVFNTLVVILDRLVLATTGLTWVTAGFGWLAIIAPIIVAAPAYFYSSMTFGELMMIVGAFNQVQQALAWFVNNFSSIADWRATLLRVASFRKTLSTMDKLGESESRIKLTEWGKNSILIDRLEIASPSGCVTLKEPQVELNAGDHVLVVGQEDEERLLFRAIAGLWPWGGGTISRPRRDAVIFVPTPGYAPPGTLRESLTYPRPPAANDDERIAKAFAIVGLEHLLPSLDANERWDRRLNDSDKLCLAFARVFLQKPQWVVVNRAFGALNPALRRRISEAFGKEATQVGVLYIGGIEDRSGFFKRVIDLVNDPNGPCFRPLAASESAGGDKAAPLPARKAG